MKPMEVGKSYFIKGLRNDYIGRVVSVGPFQVTLSDCSWVADSGRLGEFITNGRSDNMELEYLGEFTVRYDDYGLWPHTLPKESV